MLRKRQYIPAHAQSTFFFAIPCQKAAIAFLLITNNKYLSIK